MRWQEDYQSKDVIDRRGERGGGGPVAGAGLISLLPLLMRSRFGWLALLLIGGYYAYSALSGGSSRDTASETSGVAATAPGGDREAHFVAFVLDDAQANWARAFAARGAQYRPAKLVLFTDATSTGCGFGQAATGPFYCPADERVYIDLGFFRELDRKLGAKGDFAQAYVIAHEIGHHIQKQLGISERVHQSNNVKGAGGASVRLELQADCFAGAWAHSTQQRNLLEAGDLDEALTAAQAIGDDRLQRQARGTVSPESWTHGSSAQRERWFKRGFDSGKLEDCDTFSATDL